jgi:hypothetical protein
MQRYWRPRRSPPFRRNCLHSFRRRKPMFGFTDFKKSFLTKDRERMFLHFLPTHTIVNRVETAKEARK